jgi:hypothetical protein
MDHTYSAGKKKKKGTAKPVDNGGGGGGGGGASVGAGGAGIGGRPQRKSMRNVYLDDDDFSVAPSMDQDVKSVVSVSFDDVYKRGRKVS